jgi:hypothetical protein
VPPEQEEQVRRALAATARAEDGDSSPTLPPDVADRLDGVLAELVAGRAARDAGRAVPAGSDEVAARRARRWPNVLVAAAAVAVIVAAGGAVAIRGLGGGSGSETSASSDSAGGSTSQDRAAPEAGAVPSPARGDTGSKALGAVSVPRLRSASLAHDVQALADAVPAGALAPGRAGDPGAGSCVSPRAPRGAVVLAVRLDGRAATLILDPARGGTREARVYSCADAASPVATTSVAAP